ncbi:MAG TPA: ATP-binding protein [Ktedonobacteraceae bacterium]|nr:ATP-binding protein [Ktedonobacteraceae bacterium]
MSTAIWGEQEPLTAVEKYPLPLLKKLLQEMIRQFGATGGCLALYDESVGLMNIRLHLRLRSTAPTVVSNSTAGNTSSFRKRVTVDLSNPSSSSLGRMKHITQSLDADQIVSVEKSPFFKVGTTYSFGQDLVGFTWRKNEPLIIRHEDYLVSFPSTDQNVLQHDITPEWYLCAPIQIPELAFDALNRRRTTKVLGIIVLYQTNFAMAFQQKHRFEAQQFCERIALYILNDQLQHMHMRTMDYMQGLQQISTAFPAAVKLSKLVEDVYQFVTNVVDVSSMLLTFYDRDTKKIYDVFAIDNGKRNDLLLDQPMVDTPDSRPVWWKVTQEEKRTLLLTLDSQEPENYSKYEELLTGTWGDQSQAETFLLLPMKMFTRIVGSLCLTSTHEDAYSPEEILILETMVQIITVSIENAKLYDKSRQSLLKAKHREETLAAMNSALQVISTVLYVSELLQKFVETVANLVKAEMCTYFQLSTDEQELVAQAIYDTTGQWKDINQGPNRDEKHNELIEMIRLPFKDSILERLVEESFFYLDSSMVEELAQESEEGGVIFLRETHIQKMLMIPVRYRMEIVGILAIHTPRSNRTFRPDELGALLAISGQAASAIRNAQLFEQIQEAYAELQHMDKLKDEFIVTASHELRTPLSAISGYSSLLKRQSGRITPQQILRYATKISSATQQLSDLVSNMTEAAKMGVLDKKLELQLSPVQLLTAAEVAANMLSVNIEQEITLQIPDDIWVQCDALRLRQVMTNLLDNAAKYSPPHGRIIVTGSSTTLSRLPEDQVDYTQLAEGSDPPVALVRVCDEGEGLPLEDQQKIFEKFVRAPRSLTTPIRGSGLGLYICRRYIEAMGGKLWLEQSIPGEGSVFSFYLPCIKPPIEKSIEDDESAQ